MPLTFSAFAFAAGLGIFACAQDAADLGATGDGTTDVDAATDDSANPPSTTPDTGSQQAHDAAAPPPVDSAPPPLDDAAVVDANPPPTPDAAPLPNGDCDTSNAVFAGYYLYQYTHATNPPACPCTGGTCCYNQFPFPPACIK